MISLILGPDYGLAHSLLRRILKDRDPSGDSTSTLDGKSAGIRQVINDISSIGFFSAGRVVVVEDLMTRLGKQGARENGAPPDWDALFKAVPEASTLILIDPSLSAVPALVKKALPKSANIDVSKPPRGPQLISWIQDQAKHQQSSIEPRAAQALATALYPQSWASEPRNPAYDRPPDMELMEHEIAKLALSAYPNPITVETIEQMVNRESDDQLFTFLDAAASGKASIALVELQKLLDTGEDPAKLLAQLSQNIELGAVIASAGRRNPGDVGKEIGVANPGRMTAIQRGLQGQSEQTSLRRVSISAEADRLMKTGTFRDPLDALYDLILGISELRRSTLARR